MIHQASKPIRDLNEPGRRAFTRALRTTTPETALGPLAGNTLTHSARIQVVQSYKTMPKMSKKKSLGSKAIPKQPGLYTISASFKGKSVDIYSGQTNNLQRRAREHRRGGGKQLVDNVIANADQRHILIQCMKTKNPEVKEKAFIAAQKKNGAWLGLNQTKGNSSKSCPPRKTKK
ncbi:hypothetical protein AC249_AIPGENE24375 [Exaiptasia diaphana]|nr:hypothetical protein AC249_AIPGENE24375 [Exaiptasia diaphana]